MNTDTASSCAISVVVCTHNPRREFLERALQALRQQTLSTERWELLLVDNASTPPVTTWCDVNWHPRARVVIEKELGLTAARLRGIRETCGEVILFVDDDNVLDANYLVQSLALLERHATLGAIGCRILPEYEQPPAAWVKAYEHLLAIRRIDREHWSNDPLDWASQPWGAGMALRRCVCEAYAGQVARDTDRLALDRCGKQLLSGGDTDMVLTSLDLGFGYGVFPQLELKHLIDANRVREDHLLQLMRDNVYSRLTLYHRRGLPQTFRKRESLRAAINQFRIRRKRPPIERRIEQAILEGEQRFLNEQGLRRQP